MKSNRTGGNASKHREPTSSTHQRIATGYADEELLSMQPAPDAPPDAWRMYHKLLAGAGKMKPFTQ